MKKFVVFLLLNLALAANSHAALWVKLQEDKDSKLMLDKQSVLEVNKQKRAWIKIVYKKPQTNPEVAEKTYNLSKLLWFFDCASQKSATSQVFQFSDDELIYSAAVDAKDAKFIEPVPETEIDVAMRHVCGITTLPEPEKPALKPETKSEAKPEQKTEPKPELKLQSKPSEKPAKLDLTPEKLTSTLVAAAEKSDKIAVKPVLIPKPGVAEKSGVSEKTAATANADWGYEGAEGPENWAKLSPEFATCGSGRNQSPINIEETIQAELKPLKVFQRFPASDLLNNGHAIQVNFKAGNMVALDTVLYQLKQLHFHTPSENTIHGKSFPLEAHFVHADSKGNLTVLAVMFEEGQANSSLERLVSLLPSIKNSPVTIKARVLPSELLPLDKTYYRFGGSLTTPPCTEGVRWLVLRKPMSASAAQIDAFKKVIKHSNNRPVQELNGRMVLE